MSSVCVTLSDRQKLTFSLNKYLHLPNFSCRFLLLFLTTRLMSSLCVCIEPAEYYTNFWKVIMREDSSCMPHETFRKITWHSSKKAFGFGCCLFLLTFAVEKVHIIRIHKKEGVEINIYIHCTEHTFYFTTQNFVFGSSSSWFNSKVGRGGLCGSDL